MAENNESPAVERAGPGALKAAALLLGLGAEVAGQLFKGLAEPEVRQIAIAARQLRRQPGTAVGDALESFIQEMEQIGGEVAAGDEVLMKAASAALGPELARRAFKGSPAPAPPDELLGMVALADAESLAMVLAREQPQTIALVLSSLSPERAAQVMEGIPLGMRPQVVARMATVDAVAPEVLREVRQALTHELQQLVAEGMRKVDGRSAALEILRRSTAAQQNEVLQAIDKDDPTLSATLRSRLFTFDDLARLSDRDLQGLMKDLDMKQVTIALKGGSPLVKDKFLRNMSSRAAELLNDDLQAMGPVKLADVEAAQATIAKAAIEASDKGRITIVRPTDKML